MITAQRVITHFWRLRPLITLVANFRNLILDRWFYYQYNLYIITVLAPSIYQQLAGVQRASIFSVTHFLTSSTVLFCLEELRSTYSSFSHSIYDLGTCRLLYAVSLTKHIWYFDLWRAAFSRNVQPRFSHRSVLQHCLRSTEGLLQYLTLIRWRYNQADSIPCSSFNPIINVSWNAFG